MGLLQFRVCFYRIFFFIFLVVFFFFGFSEKSLKHKKISISNGHIVENQFFFLFSNGYIMRVEEVFPIFC